MHSSSCRYVVLPEQTSLRIDVLLHQAFPDRSRTYFQYLLEKGNITLQGSPLKKRDKPLSGSVLEIFFEDKHPSITTGENIPLDILYEDQDFVVINKDKNCVVHPAPGHPSGTLVNALVYHFQELEDQEPIRFGLVHRLDKDTSGVMVIAKHEKAHSALSEAFKQRLVKKHYVALCLGNPGVKTVINHLGRDVKDRKKFAIKETGKEAISHIETLIFHKGFSLVKITPETGRTHQIRVHLHSIGSPILGDPVYGSPKANKEHQIHQQMLHAYRLQFKHPFTQQELEFIAPIRQEMQKTAVSLIPAAADLDLHMKKSL